MSVNEIRMYVRMPRYYCIVIGDMRVVEINEEGLGAKNEWRRNHAMLIF